jgi:hypothetical protein
MTQSLQVPLCRLRHLYQGEITLAILRVMNPIVKESFSLTLPVIKVQVESKITRENYFEYGTDVVNSLNWQYGYP